MSMMMRRGMMVPKAVPGGLPAEYLAVQYLEGTGTQYIDTGVNADSTLGVDITFKHNNIVNTVNFGAIKKQGSSDSGTYMRHHYYHSRSSNDGYRTYGFTSYGDVTTLGATGDLRQHRLQVIPGSQYVDMYLDDYHTQVPYSSFDIGVNYYLFGRNGTGGISTTITQATIYSAKFTRDGVLVRDLVPCIRISDSKPGMYDLVGRTFYTNQGTGEFIAGDPVVPEGYLAVEYLESSGTQYFWTDVEVQDGLTVESRQSLENGNDSYLFGGCAGSNDNRSCFNGSYGHAVQGAYPSTYYNQAVQAEYGSINTIKATHENGIATIYFNGSLLSTISRTGSVVGDGTKCACFGAGRYYNPTTKVANLYKGKVYFIKVSKGNALLANYVPCVRTSDDEPGMYDTISKKFYSNEGTGEFSIPTT